MNDITFSAACQSKRSAWPRAGGGMNCLAATKEAGKFRLTSAKRHGTIRGGVEQVEGLCCPKAFLAKEKPFGSSLLLSHGVVGGRPVAPTEVISATTHTDKLNAEVSSPSHPEEAAERSRR